MLTYAIEAETSPSSFLSYAESATKFNVAALHEWSMIVENTGHFLDELKKIKVDAEEENVEDNDSGNEDKVQKRKEVGLGSKTDKTSKVDSETKIFKEDIPSKNEKKKAN